MKIYTDGGARGNPGPAGAGWHALDNQGKTLFEGFRYLGKKTNNEAEYEALIFALDQLKTFTPSTPVHFFLDSQLIVRQLNGEYKVKTPHIRILFAKVQQALLSFSCSISFHHVPRAQNRRADALVNRAIDQALG